MYMYLRIFDYVFPENSKLSLEIFNYSDVVQLIDPGPNKWCIKQSSNNIPLSGNAPGFLTQ